MGVLSGQDCAGGHGSGLNRQIIANACADLYNSGLNVLELAGSVPEPPLPSRPEPSRG